MSTNKHIDVICIVVLLCTLLLTGLFMNGEALGLTRITDGDAGDSQFTANDLNADWDRANATQITLTGDGGSVKGGGAYIYDGDVHIVHAGQYVLSGELTDGSVIIDADSSDKIWLLLDGVSLHCDNSAAILVEQAGKVFLTLAEENVVSSGAEYTAEAVSSGIDGAIYSRDDLTINGSGSLSVTAEYQHGIVGNDDLVITGGDIEITAAQDGIHANDSVRFANADITISAGDDGITVSNDDETAYIYIESGHISIPSCYEGIEALDITIAGGTIDIRPTDDGINANGRGSNSVIRITGGDITIINENGWDADGLDSNGSIYISGGKTFISVNGSGGSCALDCGTENGGVCEISGGTVVAAGGSAMAEGFDSSSKQNFIMYTTSTANPGTAVTLKNEAGDTLISETIPCSFSSVVLSTPELRLGETCTISVGGSSEEITVDNSSSSGGFGMGGMFGGRGGKMGQFAGGWPDGDADRGDMPQRPNGGFAEGDRPQMPDGGFAEGDMPQRPDGDFMDGSFPQIPDEDFTRGGGRRGGDQFMRGGQDQDWAQDAAAGETSAVSPDTLIMVGVSVLFLLAGLFIAFKVKH